MVKTIKHVRHPYIIRDKKNRGGVPIISRTGIRVMDIAVRYEVMGMTPEDIMLALPQLDLPQIHDALSYYYEHKQEIDKEWKEAIKAVDSMKKATKSVLEKKIGKIKDLH